MQSYPRMEDDSLNLHYRIGMSLIVAAIATAGSLVWSLVLGWVPCDLCWYERICMYPLVPLFVVGLVKRESFSPWNVIPFTIIGMCISVYHYLLQTVPTLGNSETCQSLVPCALPQFQWFGWITPPLLAFLAFLSITIVLCWKENHLTVKKKYV